MKFTIDEGSTIFLGCWFDAKQHLKIGRNSVINDRVRLDTRGGVEIGANVSISSEVCILTADHDLQSPMCDGRTRAVRIEDYVFIGTRAMILPGVIIGRGAAVAAGAVVSRNVKSYHIVAGVPARVIGKRIEDLRYDAIYHRWLQ